MPKYRQLHTKIIDSFDFNEMPDDFTRVVWMLLTLILDSEGRGIDNMAWVKSKMFPLRDDVTSEKLCASFKWFEEHSMIQRYEVKGRRYFYIPTFKQYQSGTQKEAVSLLPCPLELLQTCSGVSTDEVVVAESESASVFESESESACESESLTRPNIYRIYETEIGMLTPMIAEELDCIEKEYPEGWFISAVKDAKLSSTRVNLKYIMAILKRRKAEGWQPEHKDNGKARQEYSGEIILPSGQIVKVGQSQ
jgi:hypothetical protein